MWVHERKGRELTISKRQTRRNCEITGPCLQVFWALCCCSQGIPSSQHNHTYSSNAPLPQKAGSKRCGRFSRLWPGELHVTSPADLQKVKAHDRTCKSLPILVGEKTTWCSPHTNWHYHSTTHWALISVLPASDDYSKRDLTTKKQKNSGHQSSLALDRSKNDLWNSISIHIAVVDTCISSLKIKSHSVGKDLRHDHKGYKILLRKQKTTAVILIAEI